MDDSVDQRNEGQPVHGLHQGVELPVFVRQTKHKSERADDQVRADKQRYCWNQHLVGIAVVDVAPEKFGFTRRLRLIFFNIVNRVAYQSSVRSLLLKLVQVVVLNLGLGPEDELVCFDKKF